jgi:glycosyltransferase involved in cell wall biosynthesis
LKAYPDTKQKLYVINNPIDYTSILDKCDEPISIKSNRKVFLNVGRHEEFAKRLSIMINTMYRLIKEKYDIELWLVGEGPDTDKYKKMVKDLKLTKNIKFLGFSDNVYPYYKACDAVLLSSYMEGNPVVYLEAKVLNKPIISTDVADAKIELDGYGIVTEFNEESFYLGVKKFLDKGCKITSKFNPEKYNRDVMNKIYKVIED